MSRIVLGVKNHPYHQCKSGKYFWTDRVDAEKCCIGYQRILVIGGGEKNRCLMESV